MTHQAKVIVAGSRQYSRSINYRNFREIADASKSIVVSDISIDAGLMMAGDRVNPFTPFQYSDIVVMDMHCALAGPAIGIIYSKKKNDLPNKIDFAVFPML